MLYCSKCDLYQDYNSISRICDACGESNALICVPPPASPLHKIPTASELLQKRIKTKMVEGFEFLGDLPEKMRLSILLYGIYGSGKSTFALKFAAKLAENDKVAYVAAEEGKGASFRKKLEDHNLDAKKLYIIDKFGGDSTKEDIKAIGAKHIVVDSITVCKFDLDKLIDIKSMTRGILLLVSHATKTEVYRGSSSIGHEVDIVLEARDGIVISRKNRFAPKNQTYTVFTSPVLELAGV